MEYCVFGSLPRANFEPPYRFSERFAQGPISPQPPSWGSSPQPPSTRLGSLFTWLFPLAIKHGADFDEMPRGPEPLPLLLTSVGVARARPPRRGPNKNRAAHWTQRSVVCSVFSVWTRDSTKYGAFGSTSSSPHSKQWEGGGGGGEAW